MKYYKIDDKNTILEFQYLDPILEIETETPDVINSDKKILSWFIDYIINTFSKHGLHTNKSHSGKSFTLSLTQGFVKQQHDRGRLTLTHKIQLEPIYC